MEVYRTEEEQVEALKKWWSENGNSLVIGVLLALSAVFGWQAWQKHELEVSEEASSGYQEIVQAYQAAQTATADSAANNTVGHLTEKFLKEHGDSTYSQMAALLLAKHAAENNNLDEAAKQLNWVIQSAKEKPMQTLAKIRLAKVLVAQEKLDDAMKLLAAETDPAFESAIEELKGDIYASQGDLEKARAAYQKASTAAQRDNARTPILDMKLNDLAVAES